MQYVSRERLGNELRKMLKSDQPSAGLRVLAETGLLGYAFPLLEAQRGVPQDKRVGDDLWAHSLASLDAAAALARERATAYGWQPCCTTWASHRPSPTAILSVTTSRAPNWPMSYWPSLAFGRREIEPVTRLIAQHMFQYLPNWSDAAVRRFIRRVGADLVLDLLRLRQADNIGSGLPADAGRCPSCAPG